MGSGVTELALGCTAHFVYCPAPLMPCINRLEVQEQPTTGMGVINLCVDVMLRRYEQQTERAYLWKKFS